MQATTSQKALNEELRRVINAQVDATGRADGFYLSLAQSFERYHSWTERQEEALRRSLAERAARDARRATQRAQDAAQVTSPMPTGRVTISGEIVSTKWQENRFGGALKMLVRADAGWKVWGTAPASIAHLDELRGRRVTFTAAIEPKEPAFGFFSRPTNASVQAKPGQQPEATAPVAPAPAASAADGLAVGPIVQADGLEAGDVVDPSYVDPKGDFVRLMAKPGRHAAPDVCTNKPAFAVAKPSLADLIAKAKQLEAAKAQQQQPNWDTDSMVA